jgi:hypothetical protein
MVFPLSMASLLLLASPDFPDDSCNAVVPDVDVMLTAVVYPGDTAVARVFHVAALPPTIDVSSATGVPNVSGVSVAGVPGVTGVPALVWFPTMLLASLLLLVYALLPTFLQLLTFLLSLIILLLLASWFFCSNNETDILDYPTPVNLCKI